MKFRIKFRESTSRQREKWSKLSVLMSDCIRHFRTKMLKPGGGGGGFSHTLPIQVCAAQRGRDFEAPDLERGIHFRGVF